MKKLSVFFILLAIVCIQGCSKSNTTSTTTNNNTPPVAIFSCTIDGNSFFSTNITCTNPAGRGEWNITATESSVSVTNEILLYVPTPIAIGTYVIGNSSYLWADYDTGPNISNLTQYSVTGTSPFTGTCTITNNAGNMISGTFNFVCGTSSSTHTIAKGSFSNIPL